MNILKKALNTALDLSKCHKRSQAEPLLRKIYEIIQSNYYIELEDADMWKLAKALLIWYQYDNFENEYERLSVLKKIYMYAQQTIDTYEREHKPEYLEPFYESLVLHILILHRCNEDFEMIVADVYNRCMRNELPTNTHRLSQKIVLRMLYNTIVKIDDTFENFHDNEWIEKLCNTIEIENPDLTPQQLIDAEKIQQIIVRTLRNDTLIN
jgi:hypothetical protein